MNKYDCFAIQADCIDGITRILSIHNTIREAEEEWDKLVGDSEGFGLVIVPMNKGKE